MHEREKINEKKIKIHDRKKLVLGVVCIAVLAVILFLFIFLSVKVSANDKILPNVTAGGIDIGGTTLQEAKDRLAAEFTEGFNEKEFTLILEDKELKFKPSDIEAAADIEKTAEAAYNYGKEGNIFKRIKEYLKSMREDYNIEVVSQINNEKADALIAQLAEGKETPVKETEYEVTGNTLTIINGREGLQVDREEAETEIKNGIFTSGNNDIELKLEPTEPQKVDVDALYKEITESQRNAEYVRENGEIVVKDGFPKIEMDKEDLNAAINSGKETYDIEVKVTPPEVTGEELRQKLFRDKMGSQTTYFSGGNVSRASNVRLSASRINGITLLPGETFSYDAAIGKRTAENGYKAATVYVGNKEESGIGGGICQTSSTLYSAVLYANLEIVSRTSHSLPVSYIPAGQDATIAEGYIDFKFKNNTDYPVKIVAETSYGSITCSIYGVKPEGESVEIVNTRTSTLEPKVTRETNDQIPKGYKKITKKGVSGYTVSSQRIVKVNGVVQKTEKLTNSTYKAQDTIEVVNPADKDTPSENLLIYDPKTYQPPADTAAAANANAVPESGNTGENNASEAAAANQNEAAVQDSEAANVQSAEAVPASL